MRTALLVLLLLALPAPGPGQQRTLRSSSEIASAVDGLGVLGSVLYLGAHPDDENSALLAYLANGRHLRTAYLSLTRGEGGQNLLGNEQGEALGIVRTGELLAARRIDGAEQYFTSAVDFGYSKSADEALRLWDRDRVLGDIVRVIRSFRPDVIITRFSPTVGTHGHHTASAILAREAFEAAADPTRFREQLSGLRPWRARRLLYNVTTSSGQPPDSVRPLGIDVGAYDRRLGLSYTELAALSRSMHKSQGFGAAQQRGSVVHYLVPTAGEPADTDLMDGVDVSWNRVPGGGGIRRLVDRVRSAFDAADPAAAVPALVALDRELASLPDDGWVAYQRSKLREILRASLGLWVEAIAADSAVVAGDSLRFAVTALNRSQRSVRLLSVVPPFGAGGTAVNAPLLPNRPFTSAFGCAVPHDARPGTPYAPAQGSGAAGADPSRAGLPESPPPFVVRCVLSVEGEEVTFTVPVEHRSVDPVGGELRRPVIIAPAIAVELDERTIVVADDSPKTIRVRIRRIAAGSGGTLRLLPPAGWDVEPAELPLPAGRTGEVPFRIRRTASAGAGSFRVVATDASGAEYGSEFRTLGYPHIAPQVWAPPAAGRLVPLDAVRTRRAIGYIMGSGDEVPAALRQLGYRVELLGADELSQGDLGHYDAVVAGVRAYNTRPDLREEQGRLMEYVRGGGTYIVQYCIPEEGETDSVGPAPLRISRERVVTEAAPVTFLNPGHPVLNRPNRITGADFEGWVQERGLAFASSWDAAYEPVLRCGDPGEAPSDGGLLVARHGRGIYVYTGYAFFRQLPAGVPGAYRLFVNLMEASGR